MCVTDRELFSIPVFCIGPRAVLDLPDEVDFGEVPVKKLCKRVLGIRNIGDGVALVMHFDHLDSPTGEKLKIELRGKGIEALVKLKDDSVKMNDTFIGLQAKSSIFIQNQSSDFISYKWSPFKNADEESFVNETLIETFANTGNFESRMKEKLITWIRKFSEQQIVSSF
ncbi:unnamed protein product [Trichobilharzia regenti]|nr:unnamed protein product [Trichobilharzia regenti]